MYWEQFTEVRTQRPKDSDDRILCVLPRRVDRDASRLTNGNHIFILVHNDDVGVRYRRFVAMHVMEDAI